MKSLQNKARELLAAGTVKMVIGYGRGSAGSARAVFVRQASGADSLIFDETCRQNLAVYLLKPEVRELGKTAVVSLPAVLRTILQLAAENQLADNSLLALAMVDGEVVTLSTFRDMEAHVARLNFELGADEKAELQQYDDMALDERRRFWEDQFSRCLKCYACRAACPLCYCTRCTVECNQPQWIPVAAHDLGNLEWNVMRAMHLAGRCVDCGDCSRACPVGIPLYLLNRKLIGVVRENFAFQAGMAVKAANAMATFKPDDPEDFIQ